MGERELTDWRTQGIRPHMGKNEKLITVVGSHSFHKAARSSVMFCTGELPY